MSDFGFSKRGEGFVVERKGKPLRTPRGSDTVVPTEKLARAVVSEWAAQDLSKIDVKSMPLSQLTATAIDIVSSEREKIEKQLAAYAGSDLLCHRADNPADLAALQHRTWQPFLTWAGERFGAKLVIGSGVMPLLQPKEALDHLQKAIEVYDDFALTGVRQAVEVSGSLILGLAMAEKWKKADEIYAAAELDSEYQTAHWGEDAEATQRRASVKRELAEVEIWFDLIAA
jgi:chaperone required for assembly of F1-ATPase